MLPYSHMKTTVEIPDELMRRLRRKAADEDTTLRELLCAAIRQFLSPTARTKKRYKMKDGSFKGTGTVPGVDLSNWAQIRDIIYEGRGS